MNKVQLSGSTIRRVTVSSLTSREMTFSYTSPVSILMDSSLSRKVRL